MSSATEQKILEIVLELRDKFSGPLEDTGKKAKSTAQKIDELGRKFKETGERFTAAGNALTVGVTMPLVGMATQAINTGAQFQKGMNAVRAASGASGAELTKLRDKAIELGAATVFSATDAADAMTELAKAGLDTNQVMAAAAPAMDLAAAAQIGMSTAAELSIKTMASFGLAVEDLTHIGDVLLLTANKTTADVLQLGEAFKYMGPIARLAGISLEETSAAIGLLHDRGLEAGMAGRGLAGSIQAMVKGGKAQTAVMKQLKLSVLDAKGQFVGLASVVDQLNKAGPSMQQMMILFGEHAKTMAGLMDAGGDSIRSLTGELVTNSGEMRRVSEIMMEGAAGAWEELKGAYESLLIRVADGGLLEAFTTLLNTAVVPLVNDLTKMAQSFSRLNPETQQAVLKALALAAALGPVLTITGQLISGTGSLTQLAGLLSKATTAMLGFATASRVAAAAGGAAAASTGASGAGAAGAATTANTGAAQSLLNAAAVRMGFTAAGGSAGAIGGLAASAFAIWAVNIKFVVDNWDVSKKAFEDANQQLSILRPVAERATQQAALLRQNLDKLYAKQNKTPADLEAIAALESALADLDSTAKRASKSVHDVNMQTAMRENSPDFKDVFIDERPKKIVGAKGHERTVVRDLELEAKQATAVAKSIRQDMQRARDDMRAVLDQMDDDTLKGMQSIGQAVKDGSIKNQAEWDAAWAKLPEAPKMAFNQANIDAATRLGEMATLTLQHSEEVRKIIRENLPGAADIAADAFQRIANSAQTKGDQTVSVVRRTVNTILALYDHLAIKAVRRSIIPDMNAAILRSFEQNGEDVAKVVDDLKNNVLDKFGLTKKESVRAVKELTKEVEKTLRDRKFQTAIDAYLDSNAAKNLVDQFERIKAVLAPLNPAVMQTAATELQSGLARLFEDAVRQGKDLNTMFGSFIGQVEQAYVAEAMTAQHEQMKRLADAQADLANSASELEAANNRAVGDFNAAARIDEQLRKAELDRLRAAIDTAKNDEERARLTADYNRALAADTDRITSQALELSRAQKGAADSLSQLQAAMLRWKGNDRGAAWMEARGQRDAINDKSLELWKESDPLRRAQLEQELNQLILAFGEFGAQLKQGAPEIASTVQNYVIQIMQLIADKTAAAAIPFTGTASSAAAQVAAIARIGGSRVGLQHSGSRTAGYYEEYDDPNCPDGSCEKMKRWVPGGKDWDGNGAFNKPVEKSDGAQQVKERADAIAALFNEQLGNSIGAALVTHDWSNVAFTAAQNLGQAMQQAFAGMGPMGGFLGGIAGGFLTAAVSRIFGGRGSQGSQPGSSPENAMWTRSADSQDLISGLLSAVKMILNQRAASGYNTTTRQLRLSAGRIGL